MKTVLFLFGKELGDKKLFTDHKYQKSYEMLYEMAEKKDLRFCRAAYQWYDRQKNIFPYAWTYENRRWKKLKNVKPDLIYDKTKLTASCQLLKEKLGKHHRIINDPDFTLLAGHKLYTSLLLPEFFKKYYKVETRAQLEKAVKKIPGRKIVLKPAIGSGGDEIIIVDSAKWKSVKIKKPMLVQEFIDSSGGIEGITKGMHDLRLVFINDELIYAYTRIPARGSYLANVAQGGKMFIVEKRDLPENVRPLVKEVQKTFNIFHPKIYTIDLMFDKKKRPWIVEMNTMPGVYFYPEQRKWQDKFYLSLISVFKTILT